jgi:hypothetical protein
MELWRVLRALEASVANPVLRVVLRSRLHWPLSRWVCLLSYDGQVTGERYTTPVGYSQSGDILHVVTVRERSEWWKNFREPHACTLVLRGEPRRASGEVVTNAVKHRSHVVDFLHPAPVLAGSGVDGTAEDVDFTSYVLVEFSLEADTPTARESATIEATDEGPEPATTGHAE